MNESEISEKHLFQTMPVPRMVMEVRGDETVIVSAMNDMALKYFGLESEQVLGKTVDAFMDTSLTDHFIQSFEVVCAKKQSVTIQTLPGVPSGVSVYGFYISPHVNEAGDVQYIDVIGQLDVSDQSVIHRERDDAISLLTSVFEVSEIGIVVTDAQRQIIRVNESFVRTYGWEREDLMSTDFISLITPDEREGVNKIHDKCLQSGKHYSGELKVIRKDGTVANVLSTTATLELSQKRKYQVTTVMDITLRKRMEESLRMAKEQADAANRAKSMFLANMSHELRTPLNAIIGFSEMIIKATFGKIGNDKYEEYLEDIHMSARHLLEIINEVLDMSKIEAGRIDLDESDVDLNELLESVSRMMASRAFGKNINLVMDVHENLENLHVDERLVRQAIINLITNAIKFSENGSDVTIKAKTLRDQSIEIQIIDTGVGIPKEKIQQALEPFGQISDRAEDADHQGTGLGLPLSKAMIELHDGILQIESEEGEGTTAIISFPSFRTLPKQREGSKLRLK